VAGSPFALIGRLQDAARESEAIDRVRDLRFALGLRAGRRARARGWTRGASSPPATPTAPTPRCWPPARRSSARERSLDLRETARAGGHRAWSAPPFYGDASLPSILGPASGAQPAHHLHRGHHPHPRLTSSGYEDRIAVFEAVGSPRKTLRDLQGRLAQRLHRPHQPGGPELNQQVKAADARARAGLPAPRSFDGEAGALREWPQRHAPLLARYVPGPLTTA
jgi:hypothetical protein